MSNATASIPLFPLVSDAALSPCGRYRYTLYRRWDLSLPIVAFVMLNPSTADAQKDDPTIRRCIRFAQMWGNGGIVVVNLFALRATDPKALYAAEDPIGPENDMALVSATSGRRVIAAWGAHGSLRDRARRVMEILADRPMFALGLTKDGHPKHPPARGREFVPYDAKPVPFGIGGAT